MVRLNGIRHWIGQGYKQVKDELGWADFQVRSATAIRRHQTLVNCAFSVCRNTWFDQPSTSDSPATTSPQSSADDCGGRGRCTPSADTTRVLAKACARAGLAHPWLLLQRWWNAWSNKPHLTTGNNYSTPSPEGIA